MVPWWTNNAAGTLRFAPTNDFFTTAGVLTSEEVAMSTPPKRSVVKVVL